VIVVDADLTQARDPATASVLFHTRLADRARHLPGINTVSLTTPVPLTGQARHVDVRLDGEALQRTDDARSCIYLTVSPDYFDTLKLPIVRGRGFSVADGDSASAVVISDALARRFWPGRDPIGRQIMTPLSPSPRTVVGVVRDAAEGSLWREREIALYFPLPSDAAGPTRTPPALHLLTRVDGDPRPAMAALREQARAIDPRAVVDIMPLEDVLRLYMLPSRAAAIGATILSGIALLIAMIGVYSVLAYVVSQRRAEIAIRMAMGADAWQVARLVLSQGLTLVIIGIAIGLLGAVSTTRALRGALFGINPADPLTFAIVAAFLFVVALIACVIPARRATWVDPMVALRTD
jgi:putative ABC transport system permease protein